MASYSSRSAPAPVAAPQSAQAGHAAVSAPAPPAGTFVPGTKIQVGHHRVVIQKYLSEGGFAHVYLVRLPEPVAGTDQAVLKRVAVPDKDALRSMRTEVETMKRLKGHRPIVTYIDSHASELRGGAGYEVFLLMEFCNGGGLIDFMNTRLQHRLTEPEILDIFADVAEGVACMHYLRPSLLHRDLKVENVLITARDGHRKFKLCDFGSSAPPRAAPTTAAQCRAVDDDIQRHTTMQYRSPEMVDVYRKKPIDEKSDIWALGVLLYKLCYYTTPFEDQGQLAILNASYKFHQYPAFSERLKRLIASMLREHQESRPNIYQVLQEACAMQGRDVPLKDIYSSHSHSESGTQKTPVPTDQSSPAPVVGAVFSPPTKPQPSIPEVAPMRRGRPTSTQPHQACHKPSPSPKVTNGDPFAALDVKSAGAGGDELSSRFPTLDQFSILHDKAGKFDFETPSSPPGNKVENQNAKTKLAAQLADEAFASPQPLPQETVLQPLPDSDSSGDEEAPPIPVSSRMQRFEGISAPPKSASAPPRPPDTARLPTRIESPVETGSGGISRASAIISSTPELQAISSGKSQVHAQVEQTSPQRPAMVSTGTMTSTPPPERPWSSQYQIRRFTPAEDKRAANPQDYASPTAVATPGGQQPSLANSERLPSRFASTESGHQSSSSRPSLEGGRPATFLAEASLKPASSGPVPRPASTHLESNLEFLRERETGSKAVRSPTESPKLVDDSLSVLERKDNEGNIPLESNLEFLRSLEQSGSDSRTESKRMSASQSIPGSKGQLIGKFGDAFRRFETTGNSQTLVEDGRATSPPKGFGRLAPTKTPSFSDSVALEDVDANSQTLVETEEEEITPEMRREFERRRLSEEEKRVAAAAAEYRKRVGEGVPQQNSSGGMTSSSGGPAGSSAARASFIQNRVQSLLDESNRSALNVIRTAEGYGRFSDEAVGGREKDKPTVPKKTVTGGTGAIAGTGPELQTRPVPTNSTGTGKPAAPPKPTYLKKDITASSIAAQQSTLSHKPVPPRSDSLGRQEDLAATVPTLGGQQAVLNMTPQEKDTYVSDFTKRFPSLRAIETTAAGGEEAQQGSGHQGRSMDLEGER